jgi:hypothetical protein
LFCDWFAGLLLGVSFFLWKGIISWDLALLLLHPLDILDTSIAGLSIMPWEPLQGQKNLWV